MGLTWSSTEQSLYAFFKAKGFCDNGIFGLFGNLYAESAMNPKNLQNSYEKKLGFTDESYTAAVDAGSYENFVYDGAGYGLHQCTFWSRKQAMLEYHRSKGKSIGDLETQAEFIYKELSENYKSVLAVLKTAGSIREASDAVLLQFERPADTGTSVQEKRANYGKQYEELFKKQEGGNEMAYSRSVIVNILLSWKGAKEGSARHHEIIDLYNTLNPLPRGYKLTYSDAWCAGTWSAAAAKAGYTAIMPVECSCYYLIEEAKKKGIWQEDDAYVPDPGDAVLYDWDDGTNYATTDNQGAPEHVGGVWKVENGIIYVIEGNKNNEVGVRELPINGRYIRGFICPKYAEVGTINGGSGDSGTGASSTGTSINKTEKWKGITTTVLRVRKWAGTEYDTCSFSPLKEGEEIIVCDETRAADGSTWYYIKNKAGKYGFVHSAYVKAAGSSTAAASYAVGDKVKVTGTIYGNGNGTGGSLTKNGVTMYVVGLVDKNTYKYYIGLAATKGGVRQGWAAPSILEKL